MITTVSPLLRATALLLAVLVLNSPASADPLDVSARWVPLHKTSPAHDSVGNLSWRGGLELTSPDARFAELSALLVSDDGSRITSVTDKGYWVTMDLAYSPDGYLSGVKGGKIDRLHGLDGKHLAKKLDADAESLSRVDAESLACLEVESLAVAFERDHRILCYSKGIAAAATRRLDPRQFETPTWGRNKGVEALVTLDNGDLFAIIEGAEDDSESPAYIEDDDDWKPVDYQHDKGFRPTGATRLPNGDVLVIERCYNFGPCDNKRTIVRLRRLKANSIVPGARLVGKMIAELKAPLTVDNFEGVAARRAKRGETLVYLLSDDNNNKPKQRTLLLMFALTD